MISIKSVKIIYEKEQILYKHMLGHIKKTLEGKYNITLNEGQPSEWHYELFLIGSSSNVQYALSELEEFNRRVCTRGRIYKIDECLQAVKSDIDFADISTITIENMPGGIPWGQIVL